MPTTHVGLEDPHLNELATQTFSLEGKRQQALAYLGANYINHPSYQFNPRHSVNRETYELARSGFLLGIAQAAFNDRQRNPLFIRNLRVQEALSTH